MRSLSRAIDPGLLGRRPMSASLSWCPCWFLWLKHTDRRHSHRRDTWPAIHLDGVPDAVLLQVEDLACLGPRAGELANLLVGKKLDVHELLHAARGGRRWGGSDDCYQRLAAVSVGSGHAHKEASLFSVGMGRPMPGHARAVELKGGWLSQVWIA
ncbi:hypothetical protein D3C84_509740 [compost metagenome]